VTIIPLPLLHGTLDLLVLKCLSAGPQHGYAIAAMVRDYTGGALSVEDAALYQALHRLNRQDLVDAEWRPSDNNRRARFYTLTPAGRRRLRDDTANWRRYVRAVDAVLQGG
jgi:PadR family transcriptional regulator PadR